MSLTEYLYSETLAAQFAVECRDHVADWELQLTASAQRCVRAS